MNSINNLITLALKEDAGTGDITTTTLIPANQTSTAMIIVKEPGIIAGLGLIKPIYHKLSSQVKVTLRKKDGTRVKPGQIVAIIKGPTRAILTGERTVLNFLQRLSGIATLTSQFAAKAKPYGVKILDTRKTVPGWRLLDKYAVKTGGGFNHRMGLYDAFLIKNNHISVLGGINKINMDMLWKAWLKDLTAEIEVRDLNQFVFIIAMLKSVPFPKVVIMMDNMTPSQIKEAVIIRNKTAKWANRPAGQTVMLEASGGINLENVSKYAATGVDYISIGALTHSPKALDMALRVM
ncbi:MAG TPA: carboxylating nicotinate-nucleotide diphosphorylase [Planctomycetota bacterium]|nr:carboxylating nicotinate-nucleotide diphosphorylase [Planctomycetota bacterium]